jgi:uncharacterized protein (TIGR02246 family)
MSAVKEQDERAIESVMLMFQESWNSHDAASLARLFDASADFVNVVGLRAKGRAEIEAFHTPIFKTMFAESNLTMTGFHSRLLHTDVAALDAEWEMTGAKDPMGNPLPYRRGLASAVLTRNAGRRLIEVFHNQDLPLPELKSPAPTPSPYAHMADPITGR